MRLFWNTLRLASTISTSMSKASLTRRAPSGEFASTSSQTTGSWVICRKRPIVRSEPSVDMLHLAVELVCAPVVMEPEVDQMSEDDDHEAHSSKQFCTPLHGSLWAKVTSTVASMDPGDRASPEVCR